MAIREPAVAGYFYAAEKAELGRRVANFVSLGLKNGKLPLARAVVAPHAGYEYSGKTAGVSYAAILKKLESLPKEINNVTFVISGPNHTGNGSPVAFSAEDWKTPLGTMACNTELLEAVSALAPDAEIDRLAHRSEHSAEVQVPFLQHIAARAGKKARMLAICMMDQSLNASVTLAEALTRGSREYLKGKSRGTEEILFVASSDFTHYESAISARAKDSEAMGLAAGMEYAGFDALVRRKRLTICGHGPIAMAACIARGNGWAGQVLDYTNSGEAYGDFARVVGYGSIAYY